MTKGVFYGFVLTIAWGAAAAASQEPQPVPPPPPPTTGAPAMPPPNVPQQLPDAPTEASAAGPNTVQALPEPTESLAPEAVRRRRVEISIMEGVLTRAVQSAAQQIASEMQTPETGPFQLSGSLGARGFILDGYGVFFHVEIPGVQPSLISPVALEVLRQRLARGAHAEPASSSTRTMATRSGANANADYVDLVKDALVRAMIQYSKPLELQPHEWFTVIAGDGDEPLMPALLENRSMMQLRVRGADIAEYMASRLTLDEVRKRVEVRKF